MNVFFDTNILADVLLERLPFYTDSARVWSLADEARVSGFVSALSYANLHYVIRRLTGPTQAERGLQAIRSAFRTIPLDDQILSQAIESRLPDFEDAIQFFSAMHAHADYIITRDTRHFRKSSIPVLAPGEFLAAYARQ